MKLLIYASVLLFAFTAQAIPKDEPVPKDRECELNLIGMRKRAEAFKASVKLKFDQALSDVRENRIELMTQFNALAKSRSSPAGTPPPILKKETLIALGDYTGRLNESHPWSKLSSRDRESAALQILNQDPYFLWLKANAVDNRLEKIKHGQHQINRLGQKLPLFTSTDPVESLLECILISGDTHLSPDLAALRTILSLDPRLSRELKALGIKILELKKRESVLLSRQYILSTPQVVMYMNEAWDLAPSLNAARTALRSHNEDLRENFQARFPAKSYSLARKLLKQRPDIGVKIVLDYRYQHGIASNGIVDLSARREEVMELRRGIEAPPESQLSSQTLMEALAYIDGEDNADYDQFLQRIFMSPNDDGVGDYKISYLKQIIEIAQALESTSSLDQWAQSQARQSGFWY